MKFLERLQQFKNIDPLRARADAVTKFVQRAFGRGTGGLNIWARLRYRSLTRAERLELEDDAKPSVPLGHFLGNRTGACRHQATALQLAFQEVNISSKLVTGDIELRDELGLIRRQHHAWVELERLGRTPLVYDSAQLVLGTKKGSINNVMLRGHDRDITIADVGGGISAHYIDPGGSVLGINIRALGQEDIPEVLRALYGQ